MRGPGTSAIFSVIKMQERELRTWKELNWYKSKDFVGVPNAYEISTMKLSFFYMPL